MGSHRGVAESNGRLSDLHKWERSPELGPSPAGHGPVQRTKKRDPASAERQTLNCFSSNGQQVARGRTLHLSSNYLRKVEETRGTDHRPQERKSPATGEIRPSQGVLSVRKRFLNAMPASLSYVLRKSRRFSFATTSETWPTGINRLRIQASVRRPLLRRLIVQSVSVLNSRHVRMARLTYLVISLW